MSTTFCLDCERKIELGSTHKIGEKIKCTHCGVKLEIINLDPLELDWVYEGPILDTDLYDTGWLWMSPLPTKLN